MSTCHSQCGRGWDIIVLHMEMTGSDFKTAKNEVFGIVGRYSDSGTAGGWQEITRYPYHDQDGILLYAVVRLRGPDGKKVFLPERASGVEAL